MFAPNEPAPSPAALGAAPRRASHRGDHLGPGWRDTQAAVTPRSRPAARGETARVERRRPPYVEGRPELLTRIKKRPRNAWLLVKRCGVFAPDHQSAGSLSGQCERSNPCGSIPIHKGRRADQGRLKLPSTHREKGKLATRSGQEGLHAKEHNPQQRQHLQVLDLDSHDFRHLTSSNHQDDSTYPEMNRLSTQIRFITYSFVSWGVDFGPRRA